LFRHRLFTNKEVCSLGNHSDMRESFKASKNTQNTTTAVSEAGLMDFDVCQALKTTQLTSKSRIKSE